MDHHGCGRSFHLKRFGARVPLSLDLLNLTWQPPTAYLSACAALCRSICCGRQAFQCRLRQIYPVGVSSSAFRHWASRTGEESAR